MKIKQYERYDNITKELLDGIQVGDLIKINDWNRPLRVKGVSENYFVMAMPMCGKSLYSVCEKNPWGGIQHNAMTGGYFHIGRDSWVFGAPIDCETENAYSFNDKKFTDEYLALFESGESEISCRNATPIYTLYIKRWNARKIE